MRTTGIKFIAGLGCLAGIFLAIAQAQGGFEPSNPGSPLPSAGEALLNSQAGPPFFVSGDVSVAWEVVHATQGTYAGDYLYFYQLENTYNTGLITLTVLVDQSLVIAGSAGLVSGDNLANALVSGTFAHPANPYTMGQPLNLTWDPTSPNIQPTVISWTDNSELPVGDSSQTLVFASPFGPVQGGAEAQDGNIFAPATGQYVPVPSRNFTAPAPEPTSLMVWGLLGLTAVSVRWLRRRS